MNAPNTLPPNTEPVDADLAEQANPGQGIPSQDPTGAAQTMLEPHEAKREAESALVGGGLVAGATTGAVIGAAVAGPVGILAGAALGAVAGGAGGAAAGAAGVVDTPDDANNKDKASANTVRRPTDTRGDNS